MTAAVSPSSLPIIDGRFDVRSVEASVGVARNQLEDIVDGGGQLAHAEVIDDKDWTVARSVRSSSRWPMKRAVASS